MWNPLHPEKKAKLIETELNGSCQILGTGGNGRLIKDRNFSYKWLRSEELMCNMIIVDITVMHNWDLLRGHNSSVLTEKKKVNM